MSHRHIADQTILAFAKIHKNSKRTRNTNLLRSSASRHLFIGGSAKTMIAIARTGAEARQTKRFKAGMHRTEASGHCLGSLNLFLPRHGGIYRSAAWIRQARQ